MTPARFLPAIPQTSMTGLLTQGVSRILFIALLLAAITPGIQAVAPPLPGGPFSQASSAWSPCWDPANGGTLSMDNTTYRICNPTPGQPYTYIQRAPIAITGNYTGITCDPLVALSGITADFPSIKIESNAAHSTIEGCTIQKMQEGIRVEGSYSTILNNRITKNGTGIHVIGRVLPANPTQGAARNMSIMGNTITDNAQDGIYLEGVEALDLLSEKGEIANNIVSQNGKNGIRAEYVPAYVEVHGNRIFQNGNGLLIQRVTNLYIHSNEIRQNNENGIKVENGTLVQIFENTITRNGQTNQGNGIALQAGANLSTPIWSNLIKENGKNGIYLAPILPSGNETNRGSANIRCNLIENNPNAGIQFTSTSTADNTRFNIGVEKNQLRNNGKGIENSIIPGNQNYALKTIIHKNAIWNNQIGMEIGPVGHATSPIFNIAMNTISGSTTITDQDSGNRHAQNYYSDHFCRSVVSTTARLPPHEIVTVCTIPYDVPPLPLPITMDMEPLAYPYYGSFFDPRTICTFDPLPNLTNPYCGDGYINGPGEQCDGSQDGCSTNQTCIMAPGRYACRCMGETNETPTGGND